MKPEPLKNKSVSSFQDESGENIVDMEEGWYCSDDIKSSIEWLKQHIEMHKRVGSDMMDCNYCDIELIIDKAFEDVTKKQDL